MSEDIEKYTPADQSVTLFGVPAKEVVKAATELATPLATLISDRRLYTNIGTGDKKKSYVHLEGWQTLGAMLGVTAVITATEPLREDPTDAERITGYWAKAEARTLDGRVIGGSESVCTKSETRGPWKNAAPHALLGMAQTRAMSRALKGPLGFVMVLAGYQPTPAEEMDGITQVLDGEVAVDPEWGDDPETAEQLAAAARAARAVDPVAWSPAKIRARLSGADQADREVLLAELNEWLNEQNVEPTL